MKKNISFVMLVAVMLCLTACAETVIMEEGIENFSKADSSMSLNQALMPDGLLENVTYVTAEYYYKDFYPRDIACSHDGIFTSIEQSIVILKYGKNEYASVKEYCLESMELSYETSFEYNGYIFIENTAVMNKFPTGFNMLSYNDEERCLIFMGFYASRHYYEEVEEAAKDWPSFLDKYFGEFYSFD